METKAQVNKPQEMGRRRRKRKICGSAPELDRAPSAADTWNRPGSSDKVLARVVGTLKTQDMSPLHRACLKGDLGSLQVLLASGEWCINSHEEAQGRRPLHMLLTDVISPQTLICLKYLLLHGADVNLASESGETPLHLAVAKGLMDIIQILVKAGADLYARDQFGLQPLDIARMRSYRQIGRYLKDCMWHQQKNKEFEARKQAQSLYCDLINCDKQEQIQIKTEKNAAGWAKEKNLTQREFGPEDLEKRFHSQCHVSTESRPSGKGKETEGHRSPGPEEGSMENSCIVRRSPPEQDNEERNKNSSLKSKLKPWAIYTGPEPDAQSVEPDLRGKVKVWRQINTTKPRYRSRWDRKPNEGPDLAMDTFQRVLFPRDYPPRIQAPGQRNDIDSVQRRARTQTEGTSPWTDVAMHLGHS